MKKQARIILAVFSLTGFLSGTSTLLTEERRGVFQSGDVFLEMGVGAGSPVGESFPESSRVYLPEATINLTSPNQQRQLLGLIQLGNYRAPKPYSKSLDLGVEFAVSNWFGIGFGLSSVEAGVSEYSGSMLGNDGLLSIAAQVSRTPYASESSAASLPDICISPIINPICAGNAPEIWEYESLRPKNIRFSVNTFNADLGIHFPGGEYLDPYLKIITGSGIIQGNRVLKLGYTVGFRFVFAPMSMIFIETRSAEYFVKRRSGARTSDYLSSYNENSIHTGISLRH